MTNEENRWPATAKGEAWSAPRKEGGCRWGREEAVSEPTTDRHALAGDAYASGRHLSARQALYDYQTPRYDLPGIVLDNLVGVSGLVVDVGCGNGRYVRRLRTQRPDLLTIGLDLSEGILREVPPPVMVADVAALPLADQVADAALAMHMLYHVTEPEPVVAHLASYRSWAHQAGVPFAPTLARVRERLTEHIDREGRFLISCRGGVLIGIAR